MSAIRKAWRIEGMHCPHCETAVRRALSGVSGLSEVNVSFPNGTLTALWDEKLLQEKEIDARLREAGYGLICGTMRAGWLRDVLRLLLALAAAGIFYLLLTRTAVADLMRAFPTARASMGLGALFAVGLATSLHCVAMCGGINLAQSAASAQRGAKPSRANILYNLGRLCSYTLIGGIVGALGTALSITNTAKAAIQIFAAAFMLLMALNLLGGFAGLRRFTFRLPESLSKRLLERYVRKSSFVIGLANGLMPCGPLQAMQVCALSAGSWWRCALSMCCAYLGTCMVAVAKFILPRPPLPPFNTIWRRLSPDISAITLLLSASRITVPSGTFNTRSLPFAPWRRCLLPSCPGWAANFLRWR